jgi:hypothetical protein
MSDDFEVIGDGDEVGAILSRAAGRPAPMAAVRAQPRPVLPVARPQWLHPAGVPQGVTMPNEELDYLPFEQVQFDFGGGQQKQLIALPQRPFRGERIVLAAFLQVAAGTVSDASNGVVINPAIFVGATQIGSTQGATPISVFGATAFGVRLSFPSAGQGTRIVIPLSNQITLAAGDKVVVTGTVIGRAVR